jgi:hypothetical protein
VLAAAAVLVAVTATGSVVVMSSAKQATPAAQEPPANTVKVEKDKLSAMVSQDGTLTYRARSDGSPYSVINQSFGTYTELPDGGDKVDCGDVFYRVDDNPVLLWARSRPTATCTAAMYATSGTPEVQVDFDASQQGEVKEGDPAQITLPGNKSVTGKVDQFGRNDASHHWRELVHFGSIIAVE